jgi:hypothetical protein
METTFKVARGRGLALALLTIATVLAMAASIQVTVPNLVSPQRALFQGFDELERLGAYVVDEDGELLGRMSRGYGSDSLGNKFGAGSEYKANGLFNKMSKYGDSLSSTSAFNKMASNPPEILIKRGGETYSVGLLTLNSSARTRGQRINPHLLRAWLESE